MKKLILVCAAAASLAIASLATTQASARDFYDGHRYGHWYGDRHDYDRHDRFDHRYDYRRDHRRWW